MSYLLTYTFTVRKNEMNNYVNASGLKSGFDQADIFTENVN
jgi:hypothetical protein